MLHDGQKGFLVLEILGAIGVMALLLTIVFASFSTYRDEQLLSSETFAVYSLLNEARTATLASKEGSEYGVYFQADRAVYFKGLTYATSSSYNKEILVNPRVSLSRILNSGGDMVVFSRLTGEASTFGTTTISLVSDPGKSRDVVIGTSGIVTQ